MERIVVGVGDSASHKAVEWVIRRAAHRAVEVRLVRAFDMLAPDPNDNRITLDRVRDHVRKALPGTEVHTSLEMKTVPDALVDAAEHANLVVIGAHRDHPVQSTLQGSVPLRIASRAHASTVIVPADWKPGHDREVVVGMADDDTSSAALLFAAHEAAAAHARLTVVHTWAMPVRTITDVLVSEDVELRDAHQREVSRAVDDLRDAVAHLDVRGALEERPTADALAEHARTAELVVIGSHRWGAIVGIVLGSTARALLSRTSTPICIVPPPAHVHTEVDDDEFAVDA
jgi:nucleotide-binding universal stress UspA family protein